MGVWVFFNWCESVRFIMIVLFKYWDGLGEMGLIFYILFIYEKEMYKNIDLL